MRSYEGNYLVTTHYGARRYIVNQYATEQEALRAFKACRPTINFRGPKPVVCLWKLEDRRRARRSDG